jgi:hypothetical protein
MVVGPALATTQSQCSVAGAATICAANVLQKKSAIEVGKNKVLFGPSLFV